MYTYSTHPQGAASTSSPSSSSSDKKTKVSDEEVERVVTGLLRSKGFLWLACTDQAALYYSHAGA